MSHQPQPDQIEKGLPCNLEAERLVLGSILLDDKNFASVSALLEPDDFSLDKHRRIFTRMKGLAEKGKAIDRVSLADELMRFAELESVDGLSYLVSLDDGLPRIPNLDSYTGIVREKSRLRRVIFASQHAINRALAGDESAEIVAGARDSLLSFTEADGDDGPQTPEEIITAAGGISNVLSPPPMGLETGFHRLDEMTAGMHPGELIILAARPSMGKTALALNIAQHVTLKKSKSALIFSLEMSKRALLDRLICATARVDSQRKRLGMLNSEERRRVADAVGQLAEAKLYIDDKSAATPMQMQAKVRQHIDKHGPLDVMIVDYLQLMSSGRNYENRNQEVTAISRGMKLLSSEISAPLVVLSQLSRAPETRKGNNRPQLSDLRESGCLTGDSMVTMAATGQRVPIASLVGASGFKVWGYSQDTRDVGAHLCSRVFSTGVKPVFALRTKTGKEIKATANHKFLTRYGWLRLDQINLGEEIATYGSIPQPLDTVSISHDDLYLLGHMIGNGCLLQRHSAQYTTRHEDIAHRIAACALRIFGDAVRPRVQYDNPRKQGGWYQVFFSSTRKHTHGVHSAVTEWAQRFGIFGLRSAEKFIPPAVFGLDNDHIRVFLAALWETDGTMGLREYPGKARKQAYAYYATSSRVLADGLQHLLLRIGVLSTVGKVPQRGRYANQYHVRITGGAANISRFLERAPFTSKTHAATAARVLSRAQSVRGASTTTYCAEHGILWDRVISITGAVEQECFDMTVPGVQNMEVQCFVAHNSIEQDADTVEFIFRPEVYSKDREDLRGLAEVIVAKQRNGPIGTVELVFLHQLTKFENRAEDVAPPIASTRSGKDDSSDSLYE